MFFFFLKLFSISWFVGSLYRDVMVGNIRKGALDYHIFSLLVRRKKYSFLGLGFQLLALLSLSLFFLVDYIVK